MISLRVRSRFRSNTKDQKWLKLKTARLIFSKTAPLYKKTSNFDPRWSTPLRLRFAPFLIALSVLLLQELFKKSNLDFTFKIFVFSLLFCFIQEDLSPDLNMRSFSDTRVFVKLEFSWDLNFRESRKVQFHANSSPRKLKFHGNVARTKSSPRSFN